MEMKGERTLAADRATAWKALNDVSVLQASIPGCESLTVNAGGGYDLAVNAAIGPVKARFKGTLTLADVEAPDRYTLRFESQGGPAGFARGEAHVSLEDGAAPPTTILRYVVSAQVGGRLAQVGSRLIDAAAAAMADQFFDAFARGLASLAPTAAAGPTSTAAPATSPSPARLGLWALIKSFLRRLFQK
jgi:carbon monoxide dehydrogenase subunit G